jgi:hypothetical protein
VRSPGELWHIDLTAVVGLEIFGSTLDGRGVETALAAMIHRAGRPPRYVITDQGPRFRNATGTAFCRAWSEAEWGADPRPKGTG